MLSADFIKSRNMTKKALGPVDIRGFPPTRECDFKIATGEGDLDSTDTDGGAMAAHRAASFR